MKIVHNGHTIPINEDLLDKQDAWGRLKDIIKEREEIETLLYMEDDDVRHGRLTRKLAKKYLDDLTKIEYDLQEAWGFEKDPNYHTYWLRLKGCNCPKMDNMDRIGTPHRVVLGNCLYHGKEEEDGDREV